MNDFVLKLLINAAWQVPLCGAVGWVAERLMRRWPAAWTVTCWRAAVCGAALLPTLSAWWLPRSLEGGLRIPVAVVTVTRGSTPDLAPSLPWLALLYLAFTAGMALRLLRQWRAVRRLNEDNIAVPVAFGWRRPRVILPRRFVAEAPESARLAAVAHETAHLHHGDFAYHLALEVLTLPVVFHPLLGWMKRRTANAVEMRCDESAAREFGDGKQYALGLIEAARVLGSHPAPHLSAGLFDHNSFEERIMNLTKRKSTPRRWARLAAATSLAMAFLFVTGLSASFAAQQSEQTHSVREEGVSAPKVISRTDPVYSENAREAKVSGTVLVSVEISTDGKAENVRVVRSLEESLDQAAVEAVKLWAFQPGAKDGKPVRVSAHIEVNFRLK